MYALANIPVFFISRPQPPLFSLSLNRSQNHPDLRFPASVAFFIVPTIAQSITEPPPELIHRLNALFLVTLISPTVDSGISDGRSHHCIRLPSDFRPPASGNTGSTFNSLSGFTFCWNRFPLFSGFTVTTSNNWKPTLIPVDPFTATASDHLYQVRHSSLLSNSSSCLFFLNDLLVSQCTTGHHRWPTVLLATPTAFECFLLLTGDHSLRPAAPTSSLIQVCLISP